MADRLRRMMQSPSEWEYRGSQWPNREVTLRGWDSSAVADAQAARLPALIDAAKSARPLGMSLESTVPSEAEYGTHNTVMAFGYVVGLAAVGKTSISVLDWGGGLGQYGILARAMYPSLTIEYYVRDLAAIAAVGRQHNSSASFLDTDAAALGRRYDLVVASSSLQYSEDWRKQLSGLAGVTGTCLYITRQPFVRSVPSFVVVQRPYAHGYDTEYPGWFLNRHEFLGAADDLGLRLVREFVIQERPFVPDAPEQGDYRGFLFAPRETS